MRITASIKLRPNDQQKCLLLRTMRTFNACRNLLSQIMVSSGAKTRVSLHQAGYRACRDHFPLKSRFVDRAVGSTFQYRAGSTFKPLGAICYDWRILRLKDGIAKMDSIGGWIEMPFVCSDRDAALISGRYGESDLIYRRGEFYLHVACEVPAAETAPASDYLGVDLGVANIASTSDGVRLAGNHINNLRRRHRRLRSKLQAKHTRSAKRRLRLLSGREARFARDLNHCISKQLVTLAKGTGRGIALEDLKGIRERVTVRRNQRVVLSSWGFFQLRQFLAYKCELRGVPLKLVDPAYTSRTCSVCGHCAKENRRSQSEFLCGACGFAAHADLNAAQNIRSRALTDVPYATGCEVSCHHNLVASAEARSALAAGINR